MFSSGLKNCEGTLMTQRRTHDETIEVLHDVYCCTAVRWAESHLLNDPGKLPVHLGNKCKENEHPSGWVLPSSSCSLVI